MWLLPQRSALSAGSAQVEHVVPLSRGGTDEEINLWLSCPRCNRYKGSQVQAVDPVTGQAQKLFHPRQDAWADHFHWSEDGTAIVGVSATGRATVEALRLNHPHALAVRRNWVAAGWHPP